MVGRRSLTALAASAFLFVGTPSAALAADVDSTAFQQLVQVFVPNQTAVDQVVSNYDAAEYKNAQDDGSILLNVFVTAEEKAELAAKGWLGLKTEKDASGAYTVSSVAPNSPAAQAGFRAGDVLVAYNGVALTDANKDAVKKAKAGCAVGTKVAYTVRRGNAEQTLTATLAPVPDAVLAEWMKEEEAKTQVAQKPN